MATRCPRDLHRGRGRRERARSSRPVLLNLTMPRFGERDARYPATKKPRPAPRLSGLRDLGARDEIRTRDPQLGKLDQGVRLCPALLEYQGLTSRCVPQNPAAKWSNCGPIKTVFKSTRTGSRSASGSRLDLPGVERPTAAPVAHSSAAPTASKQSAPDDLRPARYLAIGSGSRSGLSCDSMSGTVVTKIRTRQSAHAGSAHAERRVRIPITSSPKPMRSPVPGSGTGVHTAQTMELLWAAS